MTNSDQQSDPEAGEPDVQGGGRASRGPNPRPGGDEQPGGLVPPYDDRTGTDSGTDTGSDSTETPGSA